MAKIVFSKNKKTNAWLKKMYDSLFFLDTKKESISQLRRYKRDFPREIDYNILQYGSIGDYISYDDIRNIALKCGYAKSTINKMSNEDIWNWAKRTCRYVLNNYILKD